MERLLGSDFNEIDWLDMMFLTKYDVSLRPKHIGMKRSLPLDDSA